MSVPRATPLAAPVGLQRHRNVTDGQLAQVLHPAYAAGVRRVPGGRTVFRGLPFDLGGRTSKRRWLLLDRPVTVTVRPKGPVSHVVVVHFCDAWRDPATGRPADLPIGWVAPAGEPLAKYTLELTSGGTVDATIRRRFEINEGIVGWGQGAFAALPHRTDEPLDWRGPYPAQTPARYAEAGEAGLLAVLPGTWGPAQTGVTDAVPSPTDEISLWLYEIEVPDWAGPVSGVRMEPLASIEAGGGVVVAAITLVHTTHSPLAVEPRRSLRIDRTANAHGMAGTRRSALAVSVDLGQIVRERPAPPRHDGAGWEGNPAPGWGSARVAPHPGSTIVDLVMAPDAALAIDGLAVAAADLPAEGRRKRYGMVTIEALLTPTRQVDIEIVNAITRQPMPARVHVHAADGRYLAPLGHRDEINPGLNEDTGADLTLGGTDYAYVPGRFPIELPAAMVHLEAVRGFGYRPARLSIDVAQLDGPIVVPLEPAADMPGSEWTAVDCHVHFISPTSALLQARAEGIAIVNLLATQWGDHHTSLADLPAAVVGDPSGQHIVVMGSENRQNMLGHIGLLGTPSAVLPMASAGAPEARLGDPLDRLMADWADAVHAQRGLAVAVHFPLPYAEVAADIVSGRIDAVELQALTPDVDGPSIREWYRFLNCGYRLPVVGGTDKMSAEVPVGAIRTYARMDRDAEVSFEAWAAAVRAGRTFVSAGSFIALSVDGCDIGDVIQVGPGGGTVDVRATASAALPIVDRLELVHDGAVIASTSAGRSVERLEMAERVRIRKSGWLAARVTSRAQIRSAFATGMGAHSSPVYVEVKGRPAFAREDAVAIGTIIDGAHTWVTRTATVRSPEERRRMARYLEASRARLDELIRERS